MSSPTPPSSSSTSTIRRYTPPTCTLEIAAKNSPLSRWIGQSVLKHVRFKLSFDDPRISEDQWVTIGGDRTQLQSLCDAVTQYVQNFLSQSNQFLNGTRSTVATAESTTEFITTSPQTNATGIYLQPKGLISHELHLGTLATEATGSTIRLSAVQLADLAQALDEYSADVTALPNLDRPRWSASRPAWGAIAAAAVVAVGITASIVRFLEPSPTTQTATNSSQGASSNDQRLAVQPLPNNTLPNGASPAPLPLPVAPLPSSSLPANPTTPTAPTTGTAPSQPPKLTVKQEPAVQNPAPINIPVREVPVAGIPDQTASSTARSSTARSARSAENSTAPSATASAPPASIASSKIAALTAPVEPASVLAAQDTNAAAVPQVAEARAFFKSRWQPPKELTETIEYRLLLAPDGSIQNIVPLGDAADKFLDRTPMPLTGEKFVSPIKSGKPPLLRLVLSPNGNVQTFLEPQ